MKELWGEQFAKDHACNSDGYVQSSNSEDK